MRKINIVGYSFLISFAYLYSQVLSLGLRRKVIFLWWTPYHQPCLGVPHRNRGRSLFCQGRKISSFPLRKGWERIGTYRCRHLWKEEDERPQIWGPFPRHFLAHFLGTDKWAPRLPSPQSNQAVTPKNKKRRIVAHWTGYGVITIVLIQPQTWRRRYTYSK